MAKHSRRISRGTDISFQAVLQAADSRHSQTAHELEQLMRKNSHLDYLSCKFSAFNCRIHN